MSKSLEFTDRNVPKYRVTLIVPDNETEKILGFSAKKLYAEAKSKAIEVFGENSLAYQTLTNGIDFDTLTGSQFFWNTWLNSCEVLPKNKSIAVLNDAENFLNFDKNFLSGIYMDFPQLILRSNIDSYVKNQPIINDLAKKLKSEKIHGAPFEYSPENPLIITGAKLRKSTAKANEYGIILNINDAVIKNDKRFASGESSIKLGNIEKRLWTKNSGVSRLYLGEVGLYSNNDNLADSSSNGRVAIIDTEGVQNFEEYRLQLEKEKQNLTRLIEERFLKSMEFLKEECCPEF